MVNLLKINIKILLFCFVFSNISISAMMLSNADIKKRQICFKFNNAIRKGASQVFEKACSDYRNGFPFCAYGFLLDTVAKQEIGEKDGHSTYNMNEDETSSRLNAAICCCNSFISNGSESITYKGEVPLLQKKELIDRMIKLGYKLDDKTCLLVKQEHDVRIERCYKDIFKKKCLFMSATQARQDDGLALPGALKNVRSNILSIWLSFERPLI